MCKLVLHIFLQYQLQNGYKGDDKNSVLMNCSRYIQQEAQLNPIIIKERQTQIVGQTKVLIKSLVQY